jgi:hypothetical protein
MINPLKLCGNYMTHLIQELIHSFCICGFRMNLNLNWVIISSNGINQLIFVRVKSCIFFDVWTEFLNNIMHSLHDVHEMNAYGAGHVCLSVHLSVRMIQLENR